MWIAVFSNMPELIGFLCVAGVTFWMGRRYERRQWRNR